MRFYWYSCECNLPSGRKHGNRVSYSSSGIIFVDPALIVLTRSDMKIKQLIALILGLSLATTLVACSGGGGEAPASPAASPAASP